MSRSRLSWLLGTISLVLLIVNTALWCIPFYVVGTARLLVPIQRWQRACALALMWLGEGWIQCNSAVLDFVHRVDWDFRVAGELHRNTSYLISCNHQTWADIPVLQRVFNHRIPFLKFFLKQELIWVPLLGLAWWFLDLPFMKRYSRETLEKHPELRGKDLEATRRACERFRQTPTSLINFLEGTRLTRAKHAEQGSPYMHLLRPKAGGMAFVLDAMGNSLRSLLDVTIVYPGGVPNFWDLLAGRLDRVIVQVEERPIPAELLGGDYLGDAAFRARFQSWIDGLWKEKDARIEELLAGAEPGTQRAPVQEPAASMAPTST